MIRKIMLCILIFILIFFLLALAFFFVGKPSEAEKIVWGVNFSQKHTEGLGLDWKEAYLALLDDLRVKNLKLITHWDLIEPIKDEYFFEDLDWQIDEAEKRDVKIILVIGMKTGRWPECHLPDWANNLIKGEQQESILGLIENIVLRYRDRVSVWAWQTENEPFFPFGECPWLDKEFLKKEINLVKSLDLPAYNDGGRPILISDSGEFSFWIKAAALGDMVGTTLHRKVWFRELKMYISYPFNPTYYQRKAQIIQKLFNKEVIVVELQAEPWGPQFLYDSPLEEQEKTMNLERFQKNIEFAKKTGFDRFYLWGVEWWYWLKEQQNKSEIWDEAKELF